MAGLRRRRGFTLPEVLVTIAIVSILAAVLLPALNSQLSKGEANRAASDLLAIQTAANTFVSDVRRYPANLSHLTLPITGLSDIIPNPYPAPLSSKWKGPYLAKALIGGNLVTGFGATVNGALTKTAYNGIQYVTVSVTNIPEVEFNKLDEIIDDTANSSTGQLTWSSAASGTALFFALPIQ